MTDFPDSVDWVGGAIAKRRSHPSTTSEVYDVYRDSMVAVGRTLWLYGKSAIKSP
ncbi:hypothetical protein [Coleofasciculus sp.]|uniref:hypothetical protein n=1 Tax=Coleofasciculus sp. TaxID=3100458 RepID=UPI0039F7868F